MLSVLACVPAMNNFFKCRLWTVTLLLLGKRYQARKTSDFLPSYYGIDTPQSLLLALDNEVTPCVRKCKEGGKGAESWVTLLL